MRTRVRRAPGVPCALLAAIVPLLVGADAPAQEPRPISQIGLTFGTGYSDNAFRVAVDQQSGSYRSFGLNFDVLRDGTRFDSTFAGNVERRDYSQPNIDDEPVGTVNARIDVDVVPDTFVLMFNESYGQGRVSAFQVWGPTNTQEINVFTTGPRFTLPLGSRTFIRLNATHERRRFDNTNQLDSDSDEVSFGIFRAVSPATELGLSGTTREIDYSDVLPDWQDESVFVSYVRRSATGSTLLRLGKNTVGVQGVETSGPVFEAAWSRRVSARSQFRLGARRDFVDPGDRFLGTNIVGNVRPLGPNDVFLGAGIYEYSEIAIGSTTEFMRAYLTVGLDAGGSRYESNTRLDNDERRVYLAGDRTIAPQLSIGFNVSAYETDYFNVGSLNDDRVGQLWLSKAFGRRLSLRFAYSRYLRDGQGIVPISYDENIYQASLDLDLSPERQ